MHKALGLLLDCHNDTRVAVAEHGYGDSAYEIEVFLSLGALDGHSAPLAQGKRKTPVGVHQVVVGVFYGLLYAHIR